jgi:hypothetical protein
MFQEPNIQAAHEQDIHDVAEKIAALATPAPWAPPPEAERPEGFECLVRLKPRVGAPIWMGCKWSGDAGGWVAWGDPVPQEWVTAFAPLPAPGGDKETSHE